MRKLFICILLSFAAQFAFSQNVNTLSVYPEDYSRVDDHYQYKIVLNEQDKLDFWTVAIKSRMDLTDLIHLASTTLNKPLHPNAHGTREGYWVSEQLFLDSDEKELLIITRDLLTQPLEIRLFQGLFINEITTPVKIQPSRSACPCPQPFYFDREGWCPGGYCPEIIDPTITNVTHLIVHHAATTNISTNWSLIVQSIWDYHVNNNGWSDIGYNWLIDPNGNIYQGRGDNVQGAHFCGTNGSTAGICMLGEFSSQQPTPQAIAALTSLLAWKSCDISIDPNATSFHVSSNLQLPNIAGHRDGCATECPGNAFYPTMPQLRLAVQDQIDFTCANLPAPSDLIATTASSTSIALEWNDNALDETAFLLERAAWTNTQYEQIATIEQDVTNYLDESVASNSVYFYRIRATNEIDTTAYSNEVGISTVVQNLNTIAANNIKVFPNPAKEFLNIELDESDINNLKIYDVLGKPIWQQKNFSKEIININTATWPKGIYYIHFNLAKKNIFHPILVQ